MISLSEKDGSELINKDEEETKSAKRRLQRNFASICLMWIFSFTAYSGLQNLESSLNPGVGVYSLAALTGGGLISCLVAPAVISYIGSKGALIISWICLCVFVGANYYPQSYVLIPGAAVEGLATGLMWTAQGAVVTSIAIEYAQITGDNFEHILSRLFGIFCAAFQSTQIWGNLISSVVLQNTKNNHSVVDNSTVPQFCGRNDCPEDQAPGNKTEAKHTHPESTLEIILISVYMGFAVIGLVITIFMLKPEKVPKKSGPVESLKTRLLATLKLLVTNLNMALLVPFSLFTGLEQTIMYAEFTKSFVACEIGIEWVGYTMICFGVLNTLGSPLSGFLGKHLGRPGLFFIATILDIGVLVAMELWHLTRLHMVIFFAIPGVWGLADSIWQTQSAALVGSAFSDKQEPAFSNLRMFQAMGFTVGYLYSNFLCEYIKLYIVGAELMLSMVCVAIVEFRLRRKDPELDYKLDPLAY